MSTTVKVWVAELLLPASSVAVKVRITMVPAAFQNHLIAVGEIHRATQIVGGRLGMGQASSIPRQHLPAPR